MSVWPLRYRHGNETVDAFRWSADDTQREEPSWIVDALALDRARLEHGGTRNVRLAVLTRGGWSTARPGDWLVRGPLGELEVCSDAVFRKRCAFIPKLIKNTDKVPHVRAGTVWASRKNGRTIRPPVASDLSPEAGPILSPLPSPHRS
jgi:hypothetical protein